MITTSITIINNKTLASLARATAVVIITIHAINDNGNSSYC